MTQPLWRRLTIKRWFAVFGLISISTLALRAFPQAFTPTGSLNIARNVERAILLNGGKVLIVGGYDINQKILASCELYDPLTGTFTLTGNLNVARANFAITLLNNGTVLVTGGYDQNFNALASAEIYDPATAAFTLTGNLNLGRGEHTATLLGDGTVLIAGGFDSSGGTLGSAELYTPSTGTFSMTGSLRTPRGFATATALMDGTVLIDGGWFETTFVNGNALSSAEIYTPSTASFSSVGNLNLARVRNTATLLNDGTVLVVGGKDTASDILASAEVYNPATGSFRLSGNLNFARGDHSATLLSNGTVLVEGGFGCQASNCGATQLNSSTSAELYDPASGVFSPTGNLAQGRQAQTATLLTNGLVLVAGGWSDPSGILTSAELYQPASFTPPNLISISVTPVNPSLFAGASQALVATGTFNDNSTHTLASVTWSSADNTIASVANDSGSNSGIGNDSTNSGVVFGVSPGTTTIMACAGSVCGSTTITVLAAASNQSFALFGSPAGGTVIAGQSATFSLLLAPTPGFSGIVRLSCGGLPPDSQCSISPPLFKIGEAVGASATVTVETTTASGLSSTKAEARRFFGARTLVYIADVSFLVFGSGLCLLSTTRLRRRAVATVLALILNLQLVGCSASQSARSSSGIAQGRYVITVTGASGITSRAVRFSLLVE